MAREASLFQINQLQPDKRYLHIICFLVHQYKLRQDIFSDILLNCAKGTQNASMKNEKEQVFKQKDQQKETLQLLSDARILGMKIRMRKLVGTVAVAGFLVKVIVIFYSITTPH